MISKPRCFLDLLELQRILDDKVSKPRENGFEPRERLTIDIVLSIDDEVQEWLRELPKKYNFKTWKEKPYSREKELEELTDVLFFFLQYVNHTMAEDEFEELFDEFDSFEYSTLSEAIFDLKRYLYSNSYEIDELDRAFDVYLGIVKKRGFTRDELLETYWKKWQTNMKRINSDWVIHE